MAAKKDFDRKDLKIPVSLGVIMDGNGRWAKKRLLPRSAGHRAGAENLKELCRNCGRYGVKYLTVYAFSTENWSRPEDEVNQLMKLFVEFFNKYDPELEEEGIRVRFTGDIDALPENLRKVCREGEERSLHRQKMQLIVAFNYGGRREIVQAAQKIASKVASGEIDPDDIDEQMLSDNMYLPDVPDPDLIIRPSGEMRISNFLLWECAYSELWVSDCLWPDFGYEELTRAFEAYTKRDRRFGGLSREDNK
ncbi:MAG: isoprenyl transferase [Clostridiales bacterium]|nr:isoprenyl transferase [Clostridiales bacterium]